MKPISWIDSLSQSPKIAHSVCIVTVHPYDEAACLENCFPILKILQEIKRKLLEHSFLRDFTHFKKICQSWLEDLRKDLLDKHLSSASVLYFNKCISTFFYSKFFSDNLLPLVSLVISGIFNTIYILNEIFTNFEAIF